MNIRTISEEEIDMTQEFLFKMVKNLFGHDVNPVYHHDIINVKEVYIKSKTNTLIGAFDQNNTLIGTIGVKQFVDRFEAIKGIYQEDVTAEIGRCYINKDLRRAGVGSALFDHLLEFCRESGYKTIYLHTHRHLPGGFDFWIKKGFTVKLEEDDQEKTVHMEKVLLK